MRSRSSSTRFNFNAANIWTFFDTSKFFGEKMQFILFFIGFCVSLQYENKKPIHKYWEAGAKCIGNQQNIPPPNFVIG